MDYRRELKFVCSMPQLQIIDNRISTFTSMDSNAGDDGMYNIRSVYFDDLYDTFMAENESGTDSRLKIRIRIYNKKDDVIKLEFKYKENGLTRKKTTDISRRLRDKLISGQVLSAQDIGENPLLNMMTVYTHTKKLMPKVIVEYDRKVFRYDAGNVRITFDQNVRCSHDTQDFFIQDLSTIPVIHNNKHILEVKYDQLLPSHIRALLETGFLTQTTFSKYYLSRLALKGDFYDF